MSFFERNSFTTTKRAKKRKLNGLTMFTIVFALFMLVAGLTAGLTYSGFQSTSSSNGTLTFAVNGHQGTINLTHTNITNYTSTDLLLTFTLASETNYTTPTISSITMNSVPLTKDGNNFKSSSIIVATYSAPTLTINRAEVTGDLLITGSSTAQTYTITYNANGGTGSMSNSVFNYGITNDLKTNTFTRSGYTFRGWATSSNGNIRFCDGAPIKDWGNATLYAIWESDDIIIPVVDATVYYNINGSLYSRSSAYYKCSTCNGYSTSSTNTSGCTHNYGATIYHECTVCHQYKTSAGGDSSNYCSTINHPATYYHSGSYSSRTCATCGGSCYGNHHYDMTYDAGEGEGEFTCSYCGHYTWSTFWEIDDTGPCYSNPCSTCGGSGSYYEWTCCGSRNSNATGCQTNPSWTEYVAHTLNGVNYYKCSYCNGYSTSNSNTTGCTGHNHSYNTGTLYYDYTKQYGSGSATVLKSSASYTTGYYWHASYGALKIDSEFNYTDGYTYKVTQIVNSTTLRARRKVT